METLKNHYGEDCLAPYGSLPRAYNPKLADKRNFELFSRNRHLNNLGHTDLVSLHFWLHWNRIAAVFALPHGLGLRLSWQRVNFPWQARFKSLEPSQLALKICSALESAFYGLKFTLSIQLIKKLYKIKRENSNGENRLAHGTSRMHVWLRN